MDANVYLQAFITVGGAIMGIWGFVKVMKDIKHNSDAEHERRQGWDYAAKIIKERAQEWDKALVDVDNVREQITEDFNTRLDEQDAKTQQLFAMQCMILKAQGVILEALSENGIGNGEVKEMKKELNSFLAEQIGQ